jgi:carbonic anhydrase/acetyltransferase-like protein (isoleucine patch superfamily)
LWVILKSVIGDSAIVAACAFVKAGWIVPERCLVVGIPARIERELSDEELISKVNATRRYHELAANCMATLRTIGES